ncbi:MAG: TetR/AcrR family transcriptional regulator [Pseudomonadota bacterium]
MVGVRQFDEDKVLDHVMEVFWRKGAGETTMADLASATGVQRGSLYNAYGGKELLLSKALGRYAERWRDKAAAALDDPDPQTAMAGFLGTHMERMRDPINPPGCLVTGVCMEQSDFSTPISAEIEAQFNATEAALKRYFEAAQERGALPADRDPRALARFFVATTRAMAVMHKAHRGSLEPVEDVAKVALTVLGRTADLSG